MLPVNIYINICTREIRIAHCMCVFEINEELVSFSVMSNLYSTVLPSLVYVNAEHSEYLIGDCVMLKTRLGVGKHKGFGKILNFDVLLKGYKEMLNEAR